MSDFYLSEDEIGFIVRRARGEYAVDGVCERIYRLRSQDAPSDCPYMSFLKVVLGRDATWERIAPVMKAVLALHPPETLPVKDGASGRTVGKAKLKKQRNGDVVAEMEIDASQLSPSLRDALTKSWKTGKS